jgi:hypothetical protein
LAYSKEKESIFCFDKNPGINNKTKIGWIKNLRT